MVSLYRSLQHLIIPFVHSNSKIKSKNKQMSHSYIISFTFVSPQLKMRVVNDHLRPDRKITLHARARVVKFPVEKPEWHSR